MQNDLTNTFFEITWARAADSGAHGGGGGGVCDAARPPHSIRRARGTPPPTPYPELSSSNPQQVTSFEGIVIFCGHTPPHTLSIAARSSSINFAVNNLLVRIHFLIVIITWTGFAPWEFEFPLPGSLTSALLVQTRKQLDVMAIIISRSESCQRACLPRQKSRVERLKVEVEPLLS